MSENKGKKLENEEKLSSQCEGRSVCLSDWEPKGREGRTREATWKAEAAWPRTDEHSRQRAGPAKAPRSLCSPEKEHRKAQKPSVQKRSRRGHRGSGTVLQDSVW